MKNAPSRTTVNASLISNNVNSSYEMNFARKNDFTEETQINDNSTVISIRSKRNPIIFKIIQKNKVFSKQRLYSKKVIVEDTLNFSKWKLNDEVKTILNYKCQRATVNHRGRSYEAYFTSELPFNIGPWKFHGLPGVILEVNSLDGVFSMSANKIQLTNKKVILNNPYEKSISKTLSWIEFINMYRSKYEELLSYRDEDNGSVSIPKRGIETYIDD